MAEIISSGRQNRAETTKDAEVTLFTSVSDATDVTTVKKLNGLTKENNMLPPTYGFPKGEGKKFDLLPEDVYEVAVKDITLKDSRFKNEDGSTKQVLDFKFAITEEGQYNGRFVWKEAAPYLKPPAPGAKTSILYTLASTILGRELTKEECLTFGSDKVNELVGKPLRVSVKQKTSASGNVYNLVSDFLKAKGMPLATPKSAIAATETSKMGNYASPPEDEIRIEDIPF